MKIKVIQPAGLGDILFCQKIAKELIKAGNILYWPVIPQYSWIGEYLQIEGLYWEDTAEAGCTIDLQSAGRIYSDIPIMDAKYKMVGMEYSNWQKYIEIKRNHEKEDLLYAKKVSIRPYCLICDIFASPPWPLQRSIEKSNEYANVYLQPEEGFTPFDWCKIIEKADELRLVDTCFTHIIETLDVSAKKLKLYSRDGKFYTDHLWSRQWEYVA